MTMLEIVRVRLRMKTTAFDEGEITPLIEAAKNDLKRVGILVDESEPLIQQAIVLFCKAQFGFYEESEKYQIAYESFRNSIALCGDYNDVS